MATAPSSSSYRLPPSLRTPSFTREPGSPLTPSHRTHFSAPGGTLHQVEEPLVFEIGARYLRAGFANEASPRCELDWTGEMWRRVGDRVIVDPRIKRGKGGSKIKTADGREEAEENAKKIVLDDDGEELKLCEEGELWKLDLRTVDLGIVEDLVERGVRTAYNKYLLTDSKSKKLILPLPPLFPTRLLTTITTTLFLHFQPPTITYFSSPVLCTIAAGLRSALVVDIGWLETVVTPVYELRPIEGRGVGIYGRCKRGGRLLRGMWEELLNSELSKLGIESGVAMEEIEEVLVRLGWCKKFRPPPRKKGKSISGEKDGIWNESDDDDDGGDDDEQEFDDHGIDDESNPMISIPLETPAPPTTLSIPFSVLSTPAEKAFFAPTTTASASLLDPDDDDTPLAELLWKTLLNSTVDVRATLLSRIVIVGGGSQIPGLQERLIDELRAIVDTRGWDRSIGTRPLKKKPIIPIQHLSAYPEIKDGGGVGGMRSPRERYEWRREPTASPEGERDAKRKKSVPVGEVRGVKSLGAWVGGSLVAGLKGRGVVEVEREKFLSAVAAGGTGFPVGV